MAHITVISPTGRKRVELDDQNTVGRHSENKIQIPDPSVSKTHCLIAIDKNKMCFIEDRSSTNGTFVNNRKIKERTSIYNGDEIRLGNIIILFEGENQAVAQMVEIGDEDEGLFSSTMSPQMETRFLSEDKIPSEKNLRADYEKLRVTYELQNEMNLERDIGKTLDRILYRTFEFLEYDQGVILLVDKNGHLTPHSYKTRRGDEKLMISSTLLNYVQKEKTGVISTDVSSDQRFNIAESIMLEGVKSTIAVPMMIDDEILGVMIIYSLEMTDAFTTKDLGLITAIANQAARIIKNSLLHEELRQSFDSSIRTLSATVDARHPLTAGHSERVTEISLMIAREMNLPEQEIRVLKFATLMHDIGKIAVPDEVLLKNGRFSNEEKAIMDIHPKKTREILENFYFPEFLENVPLIASSHHEKMDGTGYPMGLKGDEIPLASRIMAVADMFDALTAKRDYPKYIDNKTASYDPLPLAIVMTIIKKEAGERFDSKVVEAFLRCLPYIVERFKNDHLPQDYDLSLATIP
ncbi:MAG: FHA domain-containing protein [Proteobacteria bacterium]|nr:FHA domain-containing protein [Pseudomonadota bacterium]